MPMGAPMRPTTSSTSFLSLIITIIVIVSSTSCLVVPTFGAPGPDAVALLNFKRSLSDSDALGSWNPSTTPCSGDYKNWAGVLCFDGTVWGLQLENMGLSGDIDVDSLLSLPNLRTLSFMNNNFEGPMPDFKKLGALKSLFLSNNQFSGRIPDDGFAGMGSLKKLDLSNNKISGSIPKSLAELPRLLELRLENNQFSGQIPNFVQDDLKLLNMSNNNLEGSIPESLINMYPPTSFSGNKNLCGKPLDTVCNSTNAQPPNTPINPPPPPPNNNNNYYYYSSPLKIVLIILALAVALAAIIVLFIICFRNSQTPRLGHAGSSYKQKSMANRAVEHCSPPDVISHVKKADQGKLSFVREDRQRFDLQDLLRASAEVLGSGSFGSSYKAVLVDGQAVVVKRFKQMNGIGREEFHEHMRRLGRLTHPNLLPLVAYYYRKEEKLLVFDYVHNGSLAGHLHGNHSVDQPGLDWPTRLKIIKGVAKGLAYLYNELPSLIVPHGHLKSSNVLLDESFEPLLMDYTLVPVVNPENSHQIMVAYKSPEYSQHGRATKKTDVWSLGILILEILTGKFPATYLAQGVGNNGIDLGSWVSSIAREESGGVFDTDMGGTKNGEGEMKKLLKIGVACCEEDVERRWDFKEAFEKIQELKERDE